MKETCPVTKNFIVPPNGKWDAKVLLVGSKVGAEEIRIGVPFVGNTGKILSYELGRVGLPLETCRVTNLWLYEPLTQKDPLYKDAFNFCFGKLVDELSTKRIGVLFMGAELAELFNKPLKDWYGVPIDLTGEREWLFRLVNADFCMFTANPAELFHTTAGEFRLALEKFRKKYREYKNGRVDNQ